jgi:peptidoglycan/xylan/chitin deacetylase (PgdA/CDA1 family)
MEILNNQANVYTYPLKKESILPEVRDAIYPGQLITDPMVAIQTRYIGIFWVDSTAILPGFTRSEVGRLDKKGLIANNQNMVFLTFDDWGTDKTVTGILDVLRKYDVKATFFVRTNNVIYNPNLLRAIALEGHSIASHTRTHFPLANSTDSERKFTELTEEQVSELKGDLVASYQDLQSVVGDIILNGKPALTRLFRPPTLAVSKSGLTAVLDSGFSYSVSGSSTLNDYEAKSAESLADTLLRSTKNGAVLVMHMSDNSIYTAEALDLYLGKMAELSGDKAFRFVSLAEVLN